MLPVRNRPQTQASRKTPLQKTVNQGRLSKKPLWKQLWRREGRDVEGFPVAQPRSCSVPRVHSASRARDCSKESKEDGTSAGSPKIDLCGKRKSRKCSPKKNSLQHPARLSSLPCSGVSAEAAPTSTRVPSCQQQGILARHAATRPAVSRKWSLACAASNQVRPPMPSHIRRQYSALRHLSFSRRRHQGTRTRSKAFSIL